MLAEEKSPSHFNFDPFSEPRTMPAHWDLSEYLAPASPAGSPQVNLEAGAQPDPQAGQPSAEALPAWHLDPHAALSTTPALWDLTELL